MTFASVVLTHQNNYPNQNNKKKKEITTTKTTTTKETKKKVKTKNKMDSLISKLLFSSY